MDVKETPVVVSVGEPVAQRVTDTRDGASWVCVPKTGDSNPAFWRVDDLFAAAPVVLPETPPKSALVAISGALGDVGGVQMLEDYEAVYAALRSWVAAGGETR